MFLGHLESAMKWQESRLLMEYTPPTTAREGVWKIRLCGPWIPPALDKPLIDVQSVATLLRLDAAVSNSPLRLSPNHLPTFDNEEKLNADLDSLFFELIRKTVPNTEVSVEVEMVKRIFVVTIRAREFSYGYGDDIIPRTDVGMRLYVAIERTLKWYLPEESVARDAAA